LTDDKCAFSRGITFHFSILDMGEVEKKNYFRYIKIQHGPQWPLWRHRLESTNLIAKCNNCRWKTQS
jgi:hypothetical protein